MATKAEMNILNQYLGGIKHGKEIKRSKEGCIAKNCPSSSIRWHNQPKVYEELTNKYQTSQVLNSISK